ncbi:hypothetical protein B0A52_06140 [Exophiala mesophila]|uniref:Palmitoyl-protein thioesterase 1 n=1 Tax=Exophiala mesophila TaxID=212818 RepID=A0A438N5E7_EXOME|nr:hypothetical protein B0A52_06140 [Exophiala mesophila]
MWLTRLSLLLALPAAIRAIVVYPEAQIFQDALRQPAQLAPVNPRLGVKHVLPPHRPCQHIQESVKLSPKLARPADDQEEGDEEVLRSKYITYPQILEEDMQDSWIKITKLPPKQLAPKFATPSRKTTDTLDDDDDEDNPLPVVIWHGLGDTADAAGLKDVADLIGDIHPGTYTYIISVVGTGGSGDRQASFFGNVTEQLDRVCHALHQDQILNTAPAIDAVGFSQGGQFLRAYIQRCGGWAPKVRSLITFGSQHNGVSEFQKCAGPTDWVCQGANALLKSSSVWSDFVQSRLVPAQYYRDLNDFENYLAHSNFLADINNERDVKNASYAENLSQLEKFIMVVFNDDRTVIPKESGWFAEVNATSSTVTPLRERPIYKEDWIGLKKLDEKGALEFVTVQGEHMQLADNDLKKLFGEYFGTAGKKFEKSKTDDESEWKVDL